MSEFCYVTLTEPVPVNPFFSVEDGLTIFENAEILAKCPLLKIDDLLTASELLTFVKDVVSYYFGVESVGINEDLVDVFKRGYANQFGKDYDAGFHGRMFCNSEGEGGIDDIVMIIYFFLHDMTLVTGIDVSLSHTNGIKISLSGLTSFDEIRTVLELADSYTKVLLKIGKIK